MAFESGIIPGELQGNYFLEPYTETPSASEMGILDLLQPSFQGGISAPQPKYDPIEKSVSDFANAPSSATTLAQPTFFDWDRSQADRYVNSRHYKQLGFNPNIGQENEYKYGRAQTWGDVWSNGLTGMFKLAGNTFIEGWKGWGHMADALTSWDSSKLMGTPEQLLEQDKATKDIMNKYAIFETPESEKGIFNKSFFGSMLQQSGFAVGTIAQFLSEELLTLGLSTEFSVAKLGITAPRWIGRTIKFEEVATSLKRLGDPIWKARSFSEGLVQGARKFVPLFDVGHEMYTYRKAGAGALQVAAIGVGGVRRFLSEANMAMTEARMEAAGTYGELYTKLYDEELFKTGNAPNASVLEKIKKTSLAAANDNFKVNSGILMVMNRLQFDNMFNKFKYGRSVLGEAGGFADDVVAVTGRLGGKAEGEITTRAYKKGMLGTFSTIGQIATDFGGKKAAWEATKAVGRNVFKWEASEGIQELLQEGSNTALQDYYYDLYHGYKGSSLEKSVMKGIDSQANVQGLKTFLMGALTGRLLSPLNFAVGKAKLYAGTNEKQREERETNIEDAVKQVNAFYENPKNFLPEHIANVKVQNKTAQNMEEAIANRDAYVFHNNKDSAFAKAVSSSIKLGMVGSLLDTVRAYGEAFDEKDFKEAFGMDASDTNRASIKEFFGKIADDVEEFHNNWKALKDKYGDLVKPEIYREGSEDHKMALIAKRALDDSLEIMATNDHKGKQSAIRAIALQQKMASLPLVGSSAASAMRTIGVIDHIDAEIHMLKTEIDSIDALEKKDEETRRRVKLKRQQLKDLTDWKEHHESLKTMGRKEKRRYKKATKSLESYINAKNKEANIDVNLKVDDLQDIFENLLDYIDLNKDNKDYIDAFNVMANPMQFVAVHKRLMDAIEEVAKTKEEEHLDEMAREMQGKPPVKGDDEPLTHTIKIQEDGKFSVVSPKGTVVAKDLTEQEAKDIVQALDEALKAPPTSSNSQQQQPGQQQPAQVDRKQELLKLKELILKTENLTSIMDEIFKVLDEQEYKAWQEKLDVTTVQNDLEPLLKNAATEEDIMNIVSKYLFPKFIDEKIAALETNPPTPGPKENIIQNQPKNFGENTNIIESKEGIYLVEILMKSGDKAYVILNEQGHPITHITLDEERFPNYDNSQLYLQQAQAKSIFDALVEKSISDNAEYEFDGKKLRSGTILVNDKGREFRVDTKGAPLTSGTKKVIVIIPTDARTVSMTLESLRGYRLKSEINSQTDENPNAFKLLRTNELLRVYPHVQRENGEQRADAEKRLISLILNTPKQDLLSRMTIVVVRNTDLREPYFAKDAYGANENKNLHVNPEPYQVQIRIDNQIVGYMPHYNQYSYVDDQGRRSDIDVINKEQFSRIFSVDKGKDVEEVMKKFKESYRKSRFVHQKIAYELKNENSVVLDSQKISQIFDIYTSSGEYDYEDNEDLRVSLDQLQYNKVGGYTYIIDRRKKSLGNGMHEINEVFHIDEGASIEEVKAIQKRINEARYDSNGHDQLESLGRYTAVVELPNGDIKFVSLNSSVKTKEELDLLVDNINRESANLKNSNLVEKVDPASNKKYMGAVDATLANNINAEIERQLYLAVGFNPGMRINLTVTPSGNIKVEFAVFKKGDKRPVKAEIYIRESETDERKPLDIKDINDLIERINKKIDGYNSTLQKNDPYVLQKINFKLKPSNFKRNLDKEASINEFRTLIPTVKKNVVKNANISIYSKYNPDDKSGDTKNTASATASTTSTTPSPTSEQFTGDEIDIPEDIANQQAELIAAKLKEAEEQKQKAQKKQTVAEQLTQLDKDKREAIKKIEARLRAQGMTQVQINKYDISKEPDIIAINQKIASLNGGAANKISDELTANDIEDINEFRSWMKENLPGFISEEELKLISKRMKEEGTTVGMFYMHMDHLNKTLFGKIATGKYTPFYHEAFHSVFRMLLTDSQIEKYLKEGKAEMRAKGISLAERKEKLLKSKPQFYSKFTDKQLEELAIEEYMADKFQEWKKNIKTDTSAANKSLFRRIIDLVVNFFKSLRRSSDIERLFMRIEKGKYKNSQVVANRFTNGALINITEPAFKSIQIGKRYIQNEDGEVEEIPIYLSQEESNVLASTIAAVYHRKMMEAGLLNHDEEIMDGIIADYALLYNRDVNKYYDSDEFAERYTSKVAYEQAIEKIDMLYTAFTDREFAEGLKDAIRFHSRVMGYQEKLDEEEFDKQVNQYGDRASTDNRKETYSIGGYGSLSKEVRQYLATIVEEEQDEFGNKYFVNDDGQVTGQTIIRAANANVLYNGILKAAEGCTTDEQIIDRLRLFSQHNPEVAKFWNKFSGDVGIVFDEDGNFVDISNKKQANLFQAVVKQFAQFSVNYIFANKDVNKRTTKLLQANKRSAAKNQFSIWYNAYINKFALPFEKIDKDAKSLKEFLDQKTFGLEMLANLLKKSSTFTKEELLNTRIKEIVFHLEQELGIKLSPLYIKYSYLRKFDTANLTGDDLRIVRSYENTTPLMEEDVREIAVVIKSGKNPFGNNVDPQKAMASEEQLAFLQSHETPKEETKEPAKQDPTPVDDDFEGAIGNLMDMAEGNAIFDEQVSTTSYKNAEGELVYSHQLPTFNLVRGIELQSDSFRQKLKENKFLKSNFLLNNPFFNHIANNFRISRIDGLKESHLDSDGKESKRLDVNQNKGLTYGKMSDREFVITLMDLYANNKRYEMPNDEGKKNTTPFMTSTILMGVLEASNTADLVELPIIKAVQRNDKGKLILTDTALDALYGEILREYERIQRANEEITTGKFPEGIIDGYHNGDKRGLKFIKTGKMLGDLRSMLEENAKNGEVISQDLKEQIEKQIQDYWLGDNGKATTLFVEDLVKLKILNRDEKTGNLFNNLLDNYIFRGFLNGEKKSDDQKNTLANIVPSDIRHNLAQVLLNDYINTLSVRQLFVGDAAENFKDDGGIDEVKRNKGLNGSGPSSYSVITAPELGIMHANKTSHGIIIQDPLYRGVYAGKNKEKADAQMWITNEFLRYTLFGFGRLNQAQVDVLNKIEKGESFEVKDIFGETYVDKFGRTQKRKNGSIAFNAQTNSIKLVYNDGQKYVKTSAVVLSKQLTSVNINGKWEPRPGNEELHNLRERLEKYERENQTICFAIPKSAAKGKKVNLVDDLNNIDDKHFTEYDNKFWRLQLENPSNKLKITDPTQAKQLLLAEQDDSLEVVFMGSEKDSDGNNWTVGKVKQLYLKDTEQRVKNNFFTKRDGIFNIEGGYKELKKSISQNKITPKLGKFLKMAVETLQSTGTDPQTIEFFTPLYNKETGEYTQNYDLNHPMTLDKFTQLFLAYFSKEVLSEKVPGTSAALMSNWGMKVVKRVVELDEKGQPKRWEVITRAMYERDRALYNESKNAKTWNNELDREFEGLSVGDLYIDDLRHNVPEYNKKGEIIGYFTEFMMAPHTAEDMAEYMRTGRLSEELLKAFAVRIPSQDKHSFTTLKMVDFLPAHYGSTAVLPHELIEISGADFDIDKLYMHMYDTYSKNGVRVKYGTETSKKGKFAEYIMYMSKKNKDFIEKMNELYKINVTYNQDIEAYDIDGELEPVTSYDDMESLMHDLFSSDVSAKSMMEITALKELGLPSTPDEYEKFVQIYGEQNNGVLNNRILESKMKLFNNDNIVKAKKEGETPIGFQVAEVQPLKDVIESFKTRFPILSSILVEETEDIDSILGKWRSFKNNKEGSRNIGPAVNAMLVYALLNDNKIQIRDKNLKGDSLFILEIDGHRFDSYEHSKAYNSQTGEYDGERIFYHISAIVSAMTDNAKERLAARLGLNINAIGVVSNMVALGVPLETAIMFNLQPSVREFYNRLSAINKNIQTGDEKKMTKRSLGERMLKEYADKRSKNVEERLDYAITTDILEANIKSEGANPDVDYSVLSTFLKFYKQTEAYSSVAQIMKLTQGFDTTNEAIDDIDETEELLGFNMSDEDFQKSEIPFDLRQAMLGTDSTKPHNNIVATAIRIKNQVKELQQSVFIERSSFFKRLWETIQDNLYVHPSLSERFNKELKRNIIAYLGIKAYKHQLLTNGKALKLNGLDNALIYDAEAVKRDENYKDVVDSLFELRDEYPDNYFLKFLNANPVALKDLEKGIAFVNPKNKNGINTVETNTWAKLNALEIDRIESGLLDLYTNLSTREYVYKLFNYLLVKDGGQFRSGSFIRFMPPAMFKELLDATGDAKEVLRYGFGPNRNDDYMRVFGATPLEIFNEFTRLYSTNIGSAFYVKTTGDKGRLPKNSKVEVPADYKPQVIRRDGKTLNIDLFNGIREKQLEVLTDEQGYEFVAETIKTGKFSEEENKKLAYNIALMQGAGFQVVKRQDPKDPKKTKTFIKLPYVIKVDLNAGSMTETPDYVYFVLTTAAKAKDDQKSLGIGNFLTPGETTALSSAAKYVEFKPLGSKGQWKLGGLTGELPTNMVIRDRYGKKAKDIFSNIDYDQIDLDILESQLEGVSPLQLNTAVQNLEKDWNIIVKYSGGSTVNYEYFKKEGRKEVPYDPKGANSPEELLARLDKEYAEREGKPITREVVPITPQNVPDDFDIDFGSGGIDVAGDESFLSDFIAKKKAEINKQKEDKDKGCS